MPVTLFVGTDPVPELVAAGDVVDPGQPQEPDVPSTRQEADLAPVGFEDPPDPFPVYRVVLAKPVAEFGVVQWRWRNASSSDSTVRSASRSPFG